MRGWGTRRGDGGPAEGVGAPPILQARRLRAGHKELLTSSPTGQVTTCLHPTPSQEAAPTPLGCCALTHFLLLRGRCLAAQEGCWPSDTAYARSGFES